MRRGYRNRWERDQTPHNQGIVTVPTLGTPTNYVSVEALRHRNKTPATLKLLIKYGWHKA